jgi:hypothetical protein
MKKDIFIDNNIASKFSNPQDKEYIKIAKWLLEFGPYNEIEETQYAYLVVSKKLLQEYYRSSLNSTSGTSIPSIIDKLMRDDRLIVITNTQIKEFKRDYFTKTIARKLRCNSEDRDHIPVALLSDRKFVLSTDDNFIYDLLNFPGFDVQAKKRPEEIPYF